MSQVCVYYGEELARYGFGHGHPFGTRRLETFWDELLRVGLDRVVDVCDPVVAGREAIERFHTPAYVGRVIEASERGAGLLDRGDTPAFPGVYEAAAAVVGSTLDALARIMDGRARKAFVPIAGLHHARRDAAAGFCVFNDAAVAIETLRRVHGVARVAYVDIDAHHGDGVYYAYEDDPDLIGADIHEDGRHLYPGTGGAGETGRGPARGCKLNIPLPPGAGDQEFLAAWARVEEFLRRARPEFFLMQCGADSLGGDPIAHLGLSAASHAHAAAGLCSLAGESAGGRLLATGGGGYAPANIAAAWTAVVRALVEG